MSQVCKIDKVLLFDINYVLARQLTLDCLVWNLHSAGVKQEKSIQHLFKLSGCSDPILELLHLLGLLLLSLESDTFLVFHLWPFFTDLNH